MEKLLNKFGLRHVAGALMWVLREVLHLDERLMLCQPDSCRGEWLLREIMEGGNFGRAFESRKFSLAKRLFAGRLRNLKLMRFDFWEVLWQQMDLGRWLGPSGTGKSTHARLWLQHIGDTALVNDDNPIVRIGTEGSAVVYGSPWSCKTPCYRNVCCQLGGIVVLCQAPYNKIRRMKGIEAYVDLMASISGKRWDERIADGLHQTENTLVSTVPVWHLECLPDEEAARLWFRLRPVRRYLLAIYKRL